MYFSLSKSSVVQVCVALNCSRIEQNDYFVKKYIHTTHIHNTQVMKYEELTLSGRALGLDRWITVLAPKYVRNSFTVTLPSLSFLKKK